MYWSLIGLHCLGRAGAAPAEAAKRWLRRCFAAIPASEADLEPAGGFCECGPVAGSSGEGSWRQPQLALTYASLASLLLLGDDLEWLDADSVRRFLARAQLPDGSMAPSLDAAAAAARDAGSACGDSAVPDVAAAAAGPAPAGPEAAVSVGGGGDLRFVFSALAAEEILWALERARSTAAAGTTRDPSRSADDGDAAVSSASGGRGSAPAVRGDTSAAAGRGADSGERPAKGSAVAVGTGPVGGCGVDRAAAVRYVLACQSYEGAFGLQPGQEGHGGATYCAVAALALAGALPGPRRDALLRCGAAPPALQGLALRRLVSWLSRRHTDKGGFEGRPGRGADVCYSWWLGASLQMVLGGDVDDLAGSSATGAQLPTLPSCALEKFTLLAQDLARGGFGKNPDSGADPLHSAYALAGLALCRRARISLGLQRLSASTGLPASVAIAAGIPEAHVCADGVLRAMFASP